MAEAFALLEVGVLFSAVAAVGYLAARLGLSPIPLYIGAGMALNEFVLGRVGLSFVTETTFVEVGAELGIVFLLFFLGLEFDFGSLLADRARIGAVGLADLVVNFGAGLVLGFGLFGGVVPAVLVAGVVYLAVVSAVVLGGGGLAGAARSVAVALAFVAFLVVLGNYGTPLFDRLLGTTSAESLVLRTVGAVVLVAGAALAVGVSEAVAAFFVGTAVGSTAAVHDVEESLVPLRDVFGAVFFFWIGLVTDPFAFPAVAGALAVAVVVSVPSKLASGFYGGRAYGLDRRRSLRVGLAMVTRGEFSLIIAAIALAGAGGALTAARAEAVYAFGVGYVLVMTVVGTVLMGAAGTVESLLVRE